MDRCSLRGAETCILWTDADGCVLLLLSADGTSVSCLGGQQRSGSFPPTSCGLVQNLMAGSKQENVVRFRKCFDGTTYSLL